MSETYYKKSPDRPQMDETPESEYPYNNVWQSPGGMRIVWGDQRGKECFKLYHPSGTYVEFFPDGKLSTTILGENKQYNKGGVTLTVDENMDVHVSGHQRMSVGGGSHIEVQGDCGVVVGGTVAVAGLGDMAISTKGNLYLGVDKDLNLNVGGNFNQQIKGKIDIGSGGETTHQSTKIALNPSDGMSGYKS